MEEHIDSIFRLEEKAKLENTVKEGGKRPTQRYIPQDRTSEPPL
jgi:hypothetical protein